MNIASMTREFKELPISLIDEPRLPSRSAMDDVKMDELIVDIRAKGLLQPMIVARVDDRFEVIAGHRRRIACGRAGLVTAPCIIYPTRDDALDAIQFSENRHREGLSAADEAIWFSELLEQKCGGDIEKLCGLVGEKESYINNRLLLFKGDAEVFSALQRGLINIGVAHALNKCPDQTYRRYYLDCAIRGGASIALVDGWIAEWKQLFGGPQPPAASAPASEPGIPDAAHNPFTCEICGKADNVHLIRQINVHQHCKLAILDPLLATYRGEQ